MDEIGVRPKPISHTVSNFYGTEIEIWADFVPDGSTEKKICAHYEQHLRAVFSCFHRQKKLLDFL